LNGGRTGKREVLHDLKKEAHRRPGAKKHNAKGIEQWGSSFETVEKKGSTLKSGRITRGSRGMRQGTLSLQKQGAGGNPRPGDYLRDLN